MKFPLQVSFKDIEISDFVYQDIVEHAEKLERFFDRIVSCQVVVSAPHHRHKHGNVYHIQVRLHLPGSEIIFTTEPEKNHAHEDVYVAIRDAFGAVERRLKDYLQKMKRMGKTRHVPMHGKVTHIASFDGYGYLTTPDNREIYFHENAVLNGGYKFLEVGDEVRFTEEDGEKGPQASSLTRVGRSGHLSVRP
jgi:ribosomal subunit interface protein